MKNKVYDIPYEFIENSIDIGIKISEARDRGETKYVNDFSGPWGNDLTNIYFVGQGLCLDVKDAIGSQEVITLSWDRETFGYFSGGLRRLLSLPALRKLQRLMDLNGINYQPKHALS
jgi:hypothetical protein